ncbi:hypothetical protein OHA21_22845 [Actinoplanes sp. NBC_00393]|uniref:hypothetical protein n=1 Tax=Actinoplanes sp. NBC_00393 TaxID=2975953 RepID=UPI002E1E9073
MAIRKDESAARPVTAAAAGVAVTTCAVVAGAAAVVPGRVSTGDGTWEYLWEYFWVLWLLLPGLAAAGLALAARPQWRRSAAVVAMVLAAQVCGHGLVAVRDWFNTSGASGGMRQTDLAWVVVLAAVVAMCGAVAGSVSMALLWREPATGWRALRPKKPAYMVAALVVAIGLPVAVASFTMAFRTVTMLGQFGLMYGLPWGGGIAVAAWLGRRGRTVALAAVTFSALLVGAEFGARTLISSW